MRLTVVNGMLPRYSTFSRETRSHLTGRDGNTKRRNPERAKQSFAPLSSKFMGNTQPQLSAYIPPGGMTQLFFLQSKPLQPTHLNSDSSILLPGTLYPPPLTNLPITNHQSTTHHSPIYQSPLTNLPITTHQSPITNLPLTNLPIHHSPIHHSPIHHSPIHHSPIHQSPIYHSTTSFTAKPFSVA